MLASALLQKLHTDGGSQKENSLAKANGAKRKTNRTASENEAPKKKLKPKFVYKKPLTTEEINQLQESTNCLTNENLFGLQIEAILKASQMSNKNESFVQDWVQELNVFLATLTSDAEKTLDTDLKWRKKVRIPIDEQATNIPQCHFQFIAPKAAKVIGSHAVRTIIGPAVTVDVAVEIPASFFQKDNYLNQIYHKKKALYLGYLALKLKQRDGSDQIQFSFCRNNRFDPIIVVKPSAPGVRKVRINIHACCEPNAFKLSRFIPSTSNVRACLFPEVASESEQLQDTPHYNSSVLRDLTLLQNETFLRRMLESTHSNVREALVLFKLWLRTRGLAGSSFGGYLTSMFAVHLLKQRKLNATMSIFEVLRNLWINIATSRWNESGKGVSLNPEPSTSLETFHHHFDVVFLDVSGYLNLAADLPLDIYLRVRDESAKALNFLSVASLVNFRHLFTNQRPTYLQYDHIININPAANLEQIVRREGAVSLYHDYCGQMTPIVLHQISKILRQGLGKRIHSLTPIPLDRTAWDITAAPPSEQPVLSFGLILNEEFALDVLEKGPQADQDEAEDFKLFWGSKSELRRFQDGSIVEACVWTTPQAPLATRRLISRTITLHLLAHHFDICDAHVVYVADQFDGAYLSKLVPTDRVPIAASNSEQLSLAVVKSVDDLGKKLRTLEDIPLDISSVLGSSPVFRYAEVQPIVPVASHTQKSDAPINFRAYTINELVIQLGASGKWPDNLTALQRLKAAFALRIAGGLRDQHKLVAQSNGHFIDVLKDGYMFRVHIGLQKELMQMKKTINAKGVIAYRDTEQSRRYERQMFLIPRLTVNLHTLYHQHTSFGPAVMIAKRWLNAQLIDAHLWPEECTELLMARVYLQTDSLAAPVQPQAAFFRWLNLLATGDWQHEMVLLNFNDALSDQQIAQLETKFLNDRDAFPFLTIVTSAGGESTHPWTVWSDPAPAMELVARVAVLATHAAALIAHDLFSSSAGPNPVPMFIPSLDGYDVIIKLRTLHVQQTHLLNIVPATQQQRPLTAKKLAAAVKNIPVAGLNLPEIYLNELRAAYDEFALFFYDPRGGDTIAVLWKPCVQLPREFKTTTVLGCHMNDEERYVVNVPQILEDFRIIGYGLVETVTASGQWH